MATSALAVSIVVMAESDKVVSMRMQLAESRSRFELPFGSLESNVYDGSDLSISSKAFGDDKTDSTIEARDNFLTKLPKAAGARLT